MKAEMTVNPLSGQVYCLVVLLFSIVLFLLYFPQPHRHEHTSTRNKSSGQTKFASHKRTQDFLTSSCLDNIIENKIALKIRYKESQQISFQLEAKLRARVQI